VRGGIDAAIGKGGGRVTDSWIVRALGTAALMLLAAAPPPKERTFITPPKAVPSAKIHQVMLAPIYSGDFMCSEHYAGQIPYAGDALGSDCMIVGGVDGDSGYSRPFRTNGLTNEDWYGYDQPVLAPTDGEIAGVLSKSEINKPGTMGKPPAAMVQIRRADGVIVTLAHLADIRVKRGEQVKAGQVLGLVGNNGFARAPHTHIGAWREASDEPLQIRWDLNAAARLRAAD
jgi:murein DD-endopeptidase MepM/ murein hydrolase activator NlpD